MVKQLSYTKFENEILPEFRQKLNMAESTEDVKKFFFQTIRLLFEKILEKKTSIQFEDVSLRVDREPHYELSERVMSADDFRSVWKDSDLPNVLTRFARAAIKRCKHLDRHPEKTDAKIRM